jgi:serine/threonine protein phosphatase 1
MKRYVIGDIHGCLDELVILMEALPLEGADQIVFLGDYIDRGPDPRGVISYLLELKRTRAQEMIFLKGNHEDMFLSYLGLSGKHGDMFLYNGGGATLTSYGISPATPTFQERLLRVPKSHLEFLQGLRRYHVTEPFLCVHAGIRPETSLDRQDEEDLYWIREEFILNAHPLPYTILFGHTPHKEVLFHLPYKIGLDTGVVYGNKLSCIELNEKVLFQVARGKKKIRRKSVSERWKTLGALTFIDADQ